MENITAIGEILFDIYPDIQKMGGAPFNFIYHIHKLTGQGTIVSRLGDDELGSRAIGFLKANRINTFYVQTDPSHKTGIAEANLDKNKVPHWNIPDGRAFDFIENTNELKELMDRTKILYYGTLVQRNEASREVVQSYFDRDITYFCDLNIRQNFFSRKSLERSLKAANILKLNEDELKVIHKMFLDGDYNRKKCAEDLRIKFNITLLALTLGDEGAYLFRDNEVNFYTINIKNVIDTTGAGDAYAAMLLLGYLKNWELYQINKSASELAGEIIQVTSALPKDDSVYQAFMNELADI